MSPPPPKPDEPSDAAWRVEALQVCLSLATATVENIGKLALALGNFITEPTDLAMRQKRYRVAAMVVTRFPKTLPDCFVPLVAAIATATVEDVG